MLSLVFLSHSFICPHELICSSASPEDQGLKTAAQGGALAEPGPLKDTYPSL